MKARIALDVLDRHGTMICLGDKLRFDEAEWGGPHEFTITLANGELLHSGVASDFSIWCEVIESPGIEWPIEYVAAQAMETR